ncbi:MAG: murein tripeptide amidase MpaA [Gemmatimonadota bacterium]
MNLRERPERGTIAWLPDVYGRSLLGLPLEVWRSAAECRLLIFAAIHGNEGETTAVLSHALRHLRTAPAHCSVVLAANPDGLIRGTRGNARGVELNRNFPTADWRPAPVMHRETLDDPRDVSLSPGIAPGSEPETQALMALVRELQPDVVVALHAPLACIDDSNDTPLGRQLAQRTGMPLVADVGYPTPGSFGTWGAEQNLRVITYELPLIHPDDAVREHAPVLLDLLVGRL